MKVSEYIERCKKEAWDSDAEQEWQQIQKNQKMCNEFFEYFPRELSDVTPMDIIKCNEDHSKMLFKLYTETNDKLEEKEKSFDNLVSILKKEIPIEKLELFLIMSDPLSRRILKYLVSDDGK